MIRRGIFAIIGLTLLVGPVVAIGLLEFGVVPAAANPIPPKTPGSFEVARTEHDFGRVRQGEAVTVEFAFRNAGELELHVYEARVAGDCRAEISDGADFPAGARGVIRVRCETGAVGGDYLRTVTVYSTDVERRVTTLTLRGHVELDVVAEPPRLYLGRVLRGQHFDRAVALRTAHRGTVLREGRTDGGRLRAMAQSGGDSVDLEIREDAALGPFEEVVELRTSSAENPVLRVEVGGVVVERREPSRW